MQTAVCDIPMCAPALRDAFGRRILGGVPPTDVAASERLGLRILVVDDQFQWRWMIARWLTAFLGSSAGETVAVETAASGPEALAQIEELKPVLVLAAQSMTEMDGIELTQHIKAESHSPVVIVMTDASDPELEANCAAAGADFCLEKRYLHVGLLKFIQKRFSLRLARTGLA